jgi:anti-sigma factor RsiW
MSCPDWESRIALVVEGDLEDAERHQVDLHLRACVACRSLAEDLRESQALFKSIRQDMADETMLSAVRSRVLADVGALGSGNWVERVLFGGLRRKAALAAITVMIAGSVMWLSDEPRPLRQEPRLVVRNPAALAAAAPPPAPVTEPVRSERAPKPRVRRPRPAPVRDTAPAQEEEPAEQVTIKLLTDDPRVIIYWIVEKGD